MTTDTLERILFKEGIEELLRDQFEKKLEDWWATEELRLTEEFEAELPSRVEEILENLEP